MKNSPIYFESLDNMSKTFKYLGNLDGTPLVKILKLEYNKLVKVYGIRTSVSILKAYYNEATRYSMGLPIEALTPIWVKRDKGNFPKFLKKHFGGLLSSKTNLERLMALSFLRCYESISLKPVEDLSSIIEPSRGTDAFKNISKRFSKFLNNSRFSNRIRNKFKRSLATLQSKKEVEGFSLHFSGKSGISGPTVLTACEQSIAIPNLIREEFIKLDSIFKTKTTKLLDINSDYIRKGNNDFHVPRSNKDDLHRYLGRATFVPDKGGKTRLVAIGNYWIQQALLPVHDIVYDVLSGIREDGTYKQEDSFKAVLTASNDHHVWCFDLSNATDRFPLLPQIFVLKSLNTEIGDSWEIILRNLNFQSYKGEVKYSVGQPMGIYSSWAVFALTHHYIIQYCAWILGFKSFDKYRVLGDDVAIWDEDVAREYKNIILSFDVGISNAKSIIPDINSSKPAKAEFAKRLCLDGKEFTPVSPELSRTSWKNLGEFPLFLTWLDSRGYDLKKIPVSKLFSVGKFSIYQKKLIVVILFFWGLVRDPVWDLSHYQSFQLENTKFEINFLRRNRMEDQDEAINEAVDNFRADIENVSSDLRDLPEGFAFEVIMQTRLREVRELQQRLQDMDTPGHPSFKMVPALNDLEFLPDLSVENILSGLFKRSSKRQSLGEYLKRIAKTALKEIDFTESI
jgi:hypothetical protein